MEELVEAEGEIVRALHEQKYHEEEVDMEELNEKIRENQKKKEEILEKVL